MIKGVLRPNRVWRMYEPTHMKFIMFGMPHIYENEMLRKVKALS
jgi:hypothetical protein